MRGIESLAGGATSPLAGTTQSGGREETKASPAALADAAQQFEALMITQLLRAARGESQGWLGTGEDKTAASAMEMAEEQFARALAAQGGLGLASLIVSGLEQP